MDFYIDFYIEVHVQTKMTKDVWLKTKHIRGVSMTFNFLLNVNNKHFQLKDKLHPKLATCSYWDF